MGLLAKAEAIALELVQTRRDIHAHPELAFQETRTATLVAGRLRELGYEVRTGVGECPERQAELTALSPFRIPSPSTCCSPVSV